MAAGGYFGQALVVDAATGTSSTLPLPDQILRAYIGGAGLGAWLLYSLELRAPAPWPPRRRWPSCFPRS
jgi:aldehyde:ferredoxin oxidoreductase